MMWDEVSGFRDWVLGDQENEQERSNTMSKYRIRVEAIEGAEGAELNESMQEPIECDGFVIIAKQEKKIEVRKHDVSRETISKAINRDPVLLASSIIARAIGQAEEIEKKAMGKSIMEKLFDL